MYGWMCALVAAVVCCGVVRAQAFFEDVRCLPELSERPRQKVLCLPVVSAEAAPAVDGDLRDAIWKSAAHLTGFADQGTGGEPHDPIEAWVVRSTDAFHIAVRCIANIPDYPKDRIQANGMHSEDFRFLFNREPARWGRLELAVTATGKEWLAGAPSTNVVYLKDYLYPQWKPETPCTAVCLRRGNEVTVELTVPYATLGGPPVPGTEWAFDISRQYKFEFPIPDSDQFGGESADSIWGGFHGASHAQLDRWGRLFFGTAEQRTVAFRAPIVRAFCDRARYDNTDESGEAFVEIIPGSDNLDRLTLGLELLDAAGKIAAKRELRPLETGAVGVFINPQSLPVGQYEFVAKVLRATGETASVARRSFERIVGEKPAPPKMKEIPINLFHDPRLGAAVIPVSIGVPFPKGLMKDTSKLVLQEDQGNQVWPAEWRSVPAQFDVRSRWYRNGSVEWVGVSFNAEYRQGWPRQYRLLWAGQEKAPEAERPLAVDEDADGVTVVTGPAKFTLSRSHFNLIHGAWLDRNGDGEFAKEERLIDASDGGGLWYENSRKKRMNAAHGETVLRVTEKGPVRAVIEAEGWYKGKSGRECMHQTRLFFARGSRTVKVEHTWINTVDTRNGSRVREISMRLGVPGVQRYAFGNEGGAVFSGSVPRGGIYQIQLASNQCRIETAPGKSDGLDAGRMGGWLYAGSGRGGVSMAGRDLWRLYPKELAVDRDGATLYLWPVHGREVFDEQTQLEIPRLIQLLSAHQGRELDLRMPGAYYDKLGRYWQQDWAQEKPNPASFGPFIFWKAWRGLHASAQGVATSVEVDITLHGPDEGPAAAQRCAAVLDVNPHGVPDPRWTRSTDALGNLHEKDLPRFGNIEAIMDERFDVATVEQVQWLDDYGMWNWPDFHQYSFNAFAPSARAFHRSWNNNHYQESRTFYHLYLRSGEGKYWRFATARGRHTTDVDSVNYGENPPVDHFRVAGANYHPKGIIHWGGDGTVSGHYVNNDYMLHNYYLTGDPRGPEFVRMWADQYCRGVWVAESERENTGPVSEILYAYHHFRDPRWLKAITLFKEAMLAAPVADHGIPWFNTMSWWRVLKYTGDPRVKDLFVEQWGDGDKARRNGLGHGMNTALAFFLTGDKRILAGVDVGSCGRGGRNIIPPTESYYWAEVPYLMSAFEHIGAGGDVMMKSSNRAAWDAFWKADLEKWRQEGKKVFGKTP